MSKLLFIFIINLLNAQYQINKVKIRIRLDQYKIYIYYLKYFQMSKKTQKKHQEKVIQDKTFGLKNKNKSKTVQKFIKGVVNTVKNHGKSEAALQAQQIQRRKQKKKEQEEKALLDSLYKTVGDLKNQGGSDEQQVDPKSIVCPFFKQGLCQKGKKCKYSHDLTLDRNQQLDLYVDQRTQLIMNDQNQKQMKQWDEQKLMSVIREKEKAYIKQKPTQIVCKYFLEAVQKSKYGWKWQCPNGISCHYRHCLPPGFILKKALIKDAQQESQTIEQKIDKQRQKLFGDESKRGQLVTYQIFLKWKQQKKLRKQQQVQKKKKEDEKKNKGGKQHLLSGRALFQFDPTLFVDDEQAMDQKVYNQRQQIIEQDQEPTNNYLNDDIKEEQQTQQNQEIKNQNEQN